MVTDGNCIYLAEQAVNLLNRSWAFFMPILLHIGGCLYVDIVYALRGYFTICNQRIWQPLFVCHKHIFKWLQI
jgi:hypothetical protein|nr:MAG TPA: hypothetical protein [Caudoviricetes sp.]